MRHTSLPYPGSDEQLKRLSARIMAQPLDRTRPLWETWVVEGLEGDRFALITKIHHCMIDGSSGVDIAQIQMSMTPDREIPEVPRYVPRPAPTRGELLRDAIMRRITMPLKALQGFSSFANETADLSADIGARLKILWNLAGMASKADKTPLNGRLSPHRSFDWLEMSLADVKAVRKGLNCSVNDIVLTVVTGAVREFFLRRGVNLSDIDFRVSTPVSVRKEDEEGKLGNRVSTWIISLPLECEDPRDQLEAIHDTTQELKHSNQALGVEMIMAIAEYAPSSLLSLGAQSISGPINTIVTNVPGPQFPLYLQGAELEALYPQVPLLENLGLGIALMSYNGRICWGFNADPDIVPDLEAFVRLIGESFVRVADVAGVSLTDGKPDKPDHATLTNLKVVKDVAQDT